MAEVELTEREMLIARKAARRSASNTSHWGTDMGLYFSASTRGFYDDAIHATLPADAQPITEQVRAHLLDAFDPDGKHI